MNLLKAKRKPVSIAVAILAVAIFIVIILLATRPSPKKLSLQEKVWPVTVQKAVYATHTPNLVLYGTVESPKVTTLRAALDADVTNVYVKEGEKVKKGQLLITLDARDSELLLQRQEAKQQEISAMINAEGSKYKSDQQMLKHEEALIEILEKDVERRQTLYTKKVGSAVQLDDAKEELSRQRITLTNRQLQVNNYQHKLAQLQAQLATAKANVADAKLDIERTKLQSPFYGRIINVAVSVGYRVTLGSELIKLFDLSDVEIRAQIPSAYVDDAQQALDENKNITAYGFLDGRKVKITLVRLAGQVLTGRGGVDGLFRVDSVTKNLALGRSVKITVDLIPKKDVVSIPEQALYGNDLIYIVKDGRMTSINVARVGMIIDKKNNKNVLVKGDIKAGDLIITTHVPQAITGLKVKVERDIK